MRYDIELFRNMNPAREMNALERTFNQFLEEYFPNDKKAFSAGWDFNPAVDVEETDREYVMTFDIPGVNKDDIKIEIEENRVTVSGERKEMKKEQNKNRSYIERRTGKFERMFTLPVAVLSEKAEAKFDAGVLRITLPKIEASKPRTVEIKGGAA